MTGRVVILGGKGMLGQDLGEAFRAAHLHVISLDLPEFDITDYGLVARSLPLADCTINCAAYTRVDDAEVHKEEAYAINAEGARTVAQVCKKKRLRHVYISSDYVFDGARMRAYVEQDQTRPINVYGASKLGGEKAVRAEGGAYLIVRTQSLFGAHGKNFVKTIATKLKENAQPLPVVDNQVTAPTYTRHLADAIVRLVRLKVEGIVHVAASQECSWYDFARAIAARVRPDAEIHPVSYETLNLPAPRPAYSVLDTRKYRLLTGQVMPTWAQGLQDYLKEEKIIL